MINNIFNSSVTYSQTTNVKRDKNKDVEKNLKTESETKAKEDINEKVVDVKITGISEKKSSDRGSRKEINAMISQANQQTKNFEKLISSIFTKQSNKSRLAGMVQNDNLKGFFKNLTVDAKTIEQAKKDISEDGYYGVKQTSDRILSFAKAVAGNDPKSLEKMRNAVEKGFKQVEKMWGDKLPEISQKTYDKVMETFDQWQGKEKK